MRVSSNFLLALARSRKRKRKEQTGGYTNPNLWITRIRRSNVTPADPVAAIRKMIRNGVITDVVELTAEIAGYRLDDATADELRGLLH